MRCFGIAVLLTAIAVSGRMLCADEGDSLGNGKTRIPTKRFEAFREGLEDIAYMDALAKEIAKAKETKRDVSKAQALLDRRAEVMQKADYGVLDEWRLEAGRTIHELIRSSNATKSTPGKAKK